ncbi:hypothetical protein [Shewanella sp. Isolate11]|uniref:hypothetical protein n=1 Tax=Shewanella sp. Isolate11 TaxID=2908530 RepID=UPI001EFCD8B0|nr:hypothetical protein [Shewanella sp. Isolate11]MCG9697574.1 hypothetical protein [Shewanella sp. Isolate11]
MKKLLSAVAVVAVAAGSYWATQQNSSSSANAVLDYVPADTVVFSAQFEPFPIKDYIDSLPEAHKQSPQGLQDLMQNEQDPRSQFFFELVSQYFAAMKDGQTFIDTFGFPKDLSAYVYALGAIPVMKLDIEHPDKLWALLDSIEAKTGFTHQIRASAGAEYRAYTLTNESETEQIDLVFAIEKQMLTVTFATSFTDPTLLETALGVRPAADPLSQSPLIKDIFNDHGFLKDGISYINHKELVKAITTQDGNRLAKQLSELFSAINEDPFVEFRSQTCRDELDGIANNWPKTVMGYRQLNIDSQQSDISVSTVIESKNQLIMSALNQIRGFLPAYTQDHIGIFSLGLGVDVNQFVPAMTKVWGELLTPSYQCQPLREMQAEMEAQNPAMLGMFSGFANGVKGIALSVSDYQLDNDTQEFAVKNLDAIMSLSAEDPASLFNMIKPFAPMLANVNLPQDGSAIELNSLLPFPAYLDVKVYMALKGKHLVIYSGDQSKRFADKIADEALTSNGLLTMSSDYNKMFTPVMQLLEMSGEPVPEELSSLKDYNMKVKMDLDVNQQGIVIDSSVQTYK